MLVIKTRKKVQYAFKGFPMNDFVNDVIEQNMLNILSTILLVSLFIDCLNLLIAIKLIFE